MANDLRLISGAMLMLLCAGMWMQAMPARAQPAQQPYQPPRLAIRDASWGDGGVHAGTVLIELNQGLDGLRKGLQAVRLYMGVDAENQLDHLLLFQYGNRLDLKYRLKEDSRSYEDTAKATDGDSAVETLLSQVVNDTIFNPETGLYRGLIVQKITVDHQLQLIVVELQAPADWAAYEATRIATYALRLKSSRCESIVGLRAPTVIQREANSQDRVVKLSFNPSTVSDLNTADDLSRHPDVIFVARYARSSPNSATLSNAAYAHTQGEDISCEAPPPKAGTP
jgi:hypothetical protein